MNRYESIAVVLAGSHTLRVNESLPDGRNQGGTAEIIRPLLQKCNKGFFVRNRAK